MNRAKRIKKSNIKSIVIKHIERNIGFYMTLSIFFIVGICVGVYLVNNLKPVDKEKTFEYINNSISIIKEQPISNTFQIFIQSIAKNGIIVFIIWLLGLTILGSFIMYGMIFIMGVSLGYTISTIMTVLTFGKGILFFSGTMLLQSIIMIPAIFFLAVQCLNLRKEFFYKNVNYKNIIIKHTAYAILVFILLILATIVETSVSSRILHLLIKYI